MFINHPIDRPTAVEKRFSKVCRWSSDRLLGLKDSSCTRTTPRRSATAPCTAGVDRKVFAARLATTAGVRFFSAVG